MCTAVTFQPSPAKDFYFGRTLDYDSSYGEQICIVPRNMPLSFRRVGILSSHFSIIGMAHVSEGVPLFYDACNEKGLAAAGLNFPGNAVYTAEVDGFDNIPPYEFITWILSQCVSVEDVRILLSRCSMTDLPFSSNLPLSPLHWIVADRDASITVEPLSDGLKVYDNPVGILTNNPPFDWHLHNLSQYMHLTADPPQNHFAPALSLRPCSLGAGAAGLPGDYSSPSRFVRAAFARWNSVTGPSEEECISQVFHLLDTVSMPRGVVRLDGGRYEITQYTSCCNVSRGIYCYTTYENRQITAVSMHHEDLEGNHLITFPLRTDLQIHKENP